MLPNSRYCRALFLFSTAVDSSCMVARQLLAFVGMESSQRSGGM